MDKLNNKGLTLVELILTMAISAIIIGGIILFMSSSSRGYQREEREISLQIEAQTIMNQLANMVMEGNNILFDNTLPNGSRLYIYHTDNDTSTFDKMEVIWLDTIDQRLYLYHVNSNADLAAMETEITTRTNLSDNLLGEYVNQITVSPSSLVYDRKGSSTVTISLDMSYHDRTYQAEQSIKLRNRIVNIPTSTPTPP